MSKRAASGKVVRAKRVAPATRWDFPNEIIIMILDHLIRSGQRVRHLSLVNRQFAAAVREALRQWRQRIVRATYIPAPLEELGPKKLLRTQWDFQNELVVYILERLIRSGARVLRLRLVNRQFAAAVCTAIHATKRRITLRPGYNTCFGFWSPFIRALSVGPFPRDRGHLEWSSLPQALEFLSVDSVQMFTKPLFEGLPSNLRSLELGPLVGLCGDELQRLTMLRTLIVHGQSTIYDRDVFGQWTSGRFTHLTRLESLELRSMEQQPDLDFVLQLPGLRCLKLSAKNMQPLCVPTLPDLTQLDHLSVTSLYAHHAIYGVAQMTNLTRLDAALLESVSFIVVLPPRVFPKLRVLNLCGAGCNRFLNSIVVSNLQQLSLPCIYTPITDTFLAAHTNLTALDLGSRYFMDGDGLHTCDVSLSSLSQLTSLTFNTSVCRRILSSSLSFAHFSSLRQLRLVIDTFENYCLFEHCTSSLGALTDLNLTLSRESVTAPGDISGHWLSRLTRLTTLALHAICFFYGGPDILRDLRSLRELTCIECYPPPETRMVLEQRGVILNCISWHTSNNI
jgi:hypothetical protein